MNVSEILIQDNYVNMHILNDFKTEITNKQAFLKECLILK